MKVFMDAKLKFAALVLVLLISEIGGQSSFDNYFEGVEDLVSETEFRSVKLQWRYPSNKEPIGFIITLCEVTTWSKSDKDCFERHLLLGKRSALNGYDSLKTDGQGIYQATLFGLRMLTNYSVSVQAMDDQNQVGASNTDGRRANFQDNERILVRTKGFSAYATNCLANSSDIVVHTGPYFGGKIAVEGSSDDRCCLFGNRSSSQDTYTLKIDHQICGSKTVNDSRIDTVVVVHESSSVVTHNSRRFLVQCTFLPETFTIKAAFNVPQEAEAEKKNFNYKQLEEALRNLDSNDIYTYDHYKENHVKDSRMSSEQAQSVLQGSLPGYESQMLSLLIVIIVLIIVIVVVIGFSLWCYIHSHRRRSDSADIETLSTSGSSFMAYHVGDNDALVRQAPCGDDGMPVAINESIYGPTFPRTVNPFLGNQVALVSLKPVKELY
ncbi:uncharacterized protein LOC129989237 [Argiope bruennichi]|uniref:uncharacterized protein LOC129989237 n=1 Tax=Argiope bruennichi TaxID=94029 RepID=UPI002494CDEA|nr:uncharacterized protein LOC129989237 [Argiope bruennichi]